MILMESCDLEEVQKLTNPSGGWSSALFEDPAFISAFVILSLFVAAFAYYSYQTMMQKSDSYRAEVMGIFSRELKVEGHYETICPDWREKGEAIMLKFVRIQQEKEAEAQKHLRSMRRATKYAAKI